MLDEIRKSVHSMLYERLATLFFGTLVVAWLIWNWKIVYLTLFINSHLVGNKIKYIEDNYSDPCLVYVYPLISTVLLLTAVPFLSNGAYWLKWNTPLFFTKGPPLPSPIFRSKEKSIT